MDRAFTKLRKYVLQDHVSCLPTPSLLNMQSSSNGQNSITTSEVVTSQLLFQICN